MSQGATCTKIDSVFHSRGTRCHGTLYLPSGVSRPPVVVMAHGFAAERAFRLPDYAERFVMQGMAVYLFDYRNFGDSEGEPRNWVSPGRHLQDWESAIEHVRGLREINPDKLALWGTSFSGGHVIVCAARDNRISAVVAQVPYVDGLATAQTLDITYVARAMLAGFMDVVKTVLFRSPHRVPVVGDPDTLAAMNQPDSKAGYLALVPEGSSWENTCPARVFLSASLYRPGKLAPRVTCPALILIAENDSLIPAGVVQKVASRMARSETVRLPLGHFDVYQGDAFEEVVEIEARFLKKHLLPKGEETVG